MKSYSHFRRSRSTSSGEYIDDKNRLQRGDLRDAGVLACGFAVATFVPAHAWVGTGTKAPGFAARRTSVSVDIG